MNHLLQLLLLLAGIIVLAKLGGALSTRFGQPAVFGEILVGLILGPTVLNILGWPIFKDAPAHLIIGNNHPSLLGIVSDLAEIGVILLMFVAGMETDLKEMKRVGKVAFWSAFGGVVLPLLGALIACHYYGFSWSASWFIGAILTATSVSISAQTLMELKALKSKEGSTILGAAVIDDVMGIIILSLVVAFAGAQSSSGFGVGGQPESVWWIAVKMSLFFFISIYFGHKFLGKITEKVVKIPASQVLMAFVVIIAFFYAWAAEYLGKVAAITGSYIAGVLFAQTKFKKQIDHGIHPITYSMFVPIFFISIGLKANGRELGNELGFLLLIIGIAILSKVIGCWLGARLTGFNQKESIRVGIGMISRGEVGLIVAGYGLAHRIIERDVFSVMVIMVLVTTMVTPLLLRLVFPKGVETPAEPVYESVAYIEDKEREREINDNSGK
jgi:Kef-type K+ transport system membrane component KefB